MSAHPQGRFFEDFVLDETIRHPTPRTLTAGDAVLGLALYGSRFAVQSSDAFACAAGYPAAPLDDLLVFNTVFGKTVPDISRNAVANLGYAGCRFLRAVYPGDSLHAESRVLGLKANSDGRTGVVYVRSRGLNQRGETVLDLVRWVMVARREPGTETAASHVPQVPAALAPDALGDAVPYIDTDAWDDILSGSARRHGDYAAGERIDHHDGATMEEAEHQLATRLYQNTARVHFDAVATAASGRFGRRVVYGGHVMAIARAQSFNGLENAFHVAAINGGRHVAPVFAGDTVYSWSEVLDVAELPGRDDVGALRLRTVATRDRPCADFPRMDGEGRYDASVVLDLDYWVVMVR